MHRVDALQHLCNSIMHELHPFANSEESPEAGRFLAP